MKNAKDYKLKSGTEPYIRGYYRVGRYQKGKKLGWTATSDNGPDNLEDNMTTCIRATENQAGNVTLGKIEITYYVAFKNRRYNA